MKILKSNKTFFQFVNIRIKNNINILFWYLSEKVFFLFFYPHIHKYQSVKTQLIGLAWIHDFELQCNLFCLLLWALYLRISFEGLYLWCDLFSLTFLGKSPWSTVLGLLFRAKCFFLILVSPCSMNPTVK